MSARAAAAVAWGLFALFLAILVLTFMVTVFGAAPEEDLFFLAVVGYAFVGALVASRLPGNAVGWLLLAIGLVMALGALADANVHSPSAPAFTLSAWLSAWGWHIWLVCAGVFLPLLFPDGRLVSRRWRPVLWLGAVTLAFSVLGAALKPGRLDTDAAVAVDNPFGVTGAAGDVVEAMAPAGQVLLGLAIVLAAASLVVRFRRSRGTERQQLKWFAYAGLLAATGLGLALLQVLFGLEPGDRGAEAGGWLEVVGSVGWFMALGAIVIGIPTATGLAILRHRLYDIDVVINRTLVYGALTATLAGAYLTTVLLLQLALGPLTEDNDLAIAGSTLAVAALFRPLRRRIQEVVDRRFYRRRYDARQTIEAFGVRLRDQVELESLRADLREVARETMQPAHVSLWVRQAPG